MDYPVCGKIAKFRLRSVDDISKSESEIYSQIKREKQEDGFAELQLNTNNIKHEPTLEEAPTTTQGELDGECGRLLERELEFCESVDIKQDNKTEFDPQPMATVAVDSSQEPAPECSTLLSPTDDDDFNQQHYLIPGYNLIFIKEEDVQDGEEISEVDFGTVQSEAEMWPSISGTANATEVAGLNALSISPVEKYTEPTVTGKETKLYSCADCSYKTPRITNLEIHIRRHTGEKPFSCNFCDYKFVTSTNLKVHIRTHKGVKPFSCELCDHKCATSFHLKMHLRTHTGEKPFSCEFCDYKCATSGQLKLHIRTHTGVKPFSCEFCDYKCVSSGQLKLHIRTHTGVKPFSCKLCDYKCTTSGYLKIHIRTHTGVKPFSCELCDYKCAASSDLKKHIVKHTGEKPFSCNFCDYKCSYSSYLKKHIGQKHTGEKPVKKKL